eukprot:Hpha_TRINITY_DN5887_c0_g1::TRINITY_DN5887_c0_g1_i1::g.45524::m.45524
MSSLQYAFVIQLAMYATLPWLYILAFFVYRDAGWMSLHGRLKPDMAEALYRDLDVNSPTQRSIILIILTFCLRHLVLVFLAVRRRYDFGFRSAVRIDAMLFHGLQAAAFGAAGYLDPSHVDLAHPAVQQFLIIHSCCAMMFFFASDGKVKV